MHAAVASEEDDIDVVVDGQSWLTKRIVNKRRTFGWPKVWRARCFDWPNGVKGQRAFPSQANGCSSGARRAWNDAD